MRNSALLHAREGDMRETEAPLAARQTSLGFLNWRTFNLDYINGREMGISPCALLL